MKCILLDDVNESGGTELSRAEQEQWLGVYMAYMEAKPKCRRAEEQRRTAAHLSGNCPERQ